MTVTKEDVTDAVAKETGIEKVIIKKVMKSSLRVMVEALEEGNNLTLARIGVFHIKEYPPRRLHNPRTGEIIMSTGGKKVTFKQAITLKVK